MRREPDGLADLAREDRASSASSRRRSTFRSTCWRRRRRAIASRTKAERPRSCPSSFRSRRRSRCAASSPISCAACASGRGRGCPGEAGREALALADRVLEAIEAHRRTVEGRPLEAAGADRPDRRAAACTISRRSRAARGGRSRRRSASRRTPTSPGRLDGVSVAFLSRHGPGHRLVAVGDQLPREHLRLQDARLRRGPLGLGRREACKEEHAPRHAVIPDQFIDRTRHRPDTFFGDGVVAHAGFADPVCPSAASRSRGGARAQRARRHAAAASTSASRARSSRRAPSRGSTGPGERTSSG